CDASSASCVPVRRSPATGSIYCRFPTPDTVFPRRLKEI
ncbi:MAG: hypothetical protein AVDCRST_MAG71-1054, partial [uncultured Lysobacter sp.]